MTLELGVKPYFDMIMVYVNVSNNLIMHLMIVTSFLVVLGQVRKWPLYTNNHGGHINV